MQILELVSFEIVMKNEDRQVADWVERRHEKSSGESFHQQTNTNFLYLSKKASEREFQRKLFFDSSACSSPMN